MEIQRFSNREDAADHARRRMGHRDKRRLVKTILLRRRTARQWAAALIVSGGAVTLCITAAALF